jgi:hypothetical protein
MARDIVFVLVVLICVALGFVIALCCENAKPKLWHGASTAGGFWNLIPIHDKHYYRLQGIEWYNWEALAQGQIQFLNKIAPSIYTVMEESTEFVFYIPNTILAMTTSKSGRNQNQKSIVFSFGLEEHKFSNQSFQALSFFSGQEGQEKIQIVTTPQTLTYPHKTINVTTDAIYDEDMKSHVIYMNHFPFAPFRLSCSNQHFLATSEQETIIGLPLPKPSRKPNQKSTQTSTQEPIPTGIYNVITSNCEFITMEIVSNDQIKIRNCLYFAKILVAPTYILFVSEDNVIGIGAYDGS